MTHAEKQQLGILQLGILLDRLRNCRVAVALEAGEVIRKLVETNAIQAREIGRLEFEIMAHREVVDAHLGKFKLPQGHK